ncbi:MAG: DUF4011 domain-containing protein [Planctomycetota bacterium]
MTDADPPAPNDRPNESDASQEPVEAVEPAASAPSDPALVVKAEHRAVFSYALLQSGAPILETVRIEHQGQRAFQGLKLRVHLAGEAPCAEAQLGRLEPGQHVELTDLRVEPDPRALARRTEREKSQLVLEVRDPAGIPLAEQRLPIDLLPADHWPGVNVLPEVLAAFVTPNHPALEPLLADAAQPLAEATGSGALDGYQSKDPIRAARIAEAMFLAVHQKGLRYVNPPASFEQQGQRVRFVDRILDSQQAACLDLSLLLASLWEQAGLNALVLVADGHALPAIWTTDQRFPDAAIDDLGPAAKRAQLDEILPVEATHLTQPGADFAGAVDAARRWLADRSAGLTLDVRRAREAGVRPLPLHAERPDADPRNPSASPIDPEAAPDRRFSLDVAPDRFDPEAEPAQVDPADRLERWKRKLLDLSLFNRLLNLKDTQRTLRILAPDPAALEDTLAQGAELELLSRGRLPESLAQLAAAAERSPDQQADLDRFLTEELGRGRAYVDHPPAEAEKRLLNLYREARTSLEETGSNLLNLGLGRLAWYESPTAPKTRRAPLLLMPLRLTRVRAEQTYRIALTEEPPRPNAALLEMLRVDFGLDEPALRQLPEDTDGVDVQQVWRRFQHVVKDMPRWAVEPSADVGLFSFNKFLMWLDLEERGDQLRQSPLARWLLDRDPAALDRSPFPSRSELDHQPPDQAPLCTRDADSSQLAAVAAATSGRTFVLEGPPGSGKSQTITNLIADALGKGQRVLFVAEKQAALSVVRRRLEQDGLGPFVFELHSNKARKIEALDQLREALELGRKNEPRSWSRHCEDLHAQRGALSAYADQLHAERASGESVFQNVGRLAALRDTGPVDLPDLDAPSLDANRLHALRQTADDLDNAVDWIGPPARHPLAGVGVVEMPLDLPRRAGADLESLQAASRTLRQAITPAAAEALGLYPDAQAVATCPHRWLNELALRLLSPEPVGPALFDEPQWSSFQESFESAAEQGAARDAEQAALAKRYRPSFLETDPAPLLAGLDAADRSFFLLRWFKRRTARKPILAHAEHRETDPDALRQDVAALTRYREADAQLHASPLGASFGRAWNAGRPDWSALRAQVVWAGALRKLWSAGPAAFRQDPANKARAQAVALEAAERFAPGESARAALENLNQALHGFDTSLPQFTQTLAVDWSEADSVEPPSPFDPGKDDGPAALDRLDAVTQRYRQHLDKLNDWTQWTRARSAAHTQGIGPVAQALLKPAESNENDTQRDTRPSAGTLLERSLVGPWLESHVERSGALRGFHAPRHDAAVDRFQQDDADLIQQAGKVLRARLTRRVRKTVEHAESDAPDELRLLRRELEKRRQHVPIRRLVERLPTLLPGLKPCFLMSPLSVAQYLDPATPLFDLVVFDEASQIPAWDAVGAVARGKAVVVVGDSKQLPPTSFFTRLGGDEDAALPADQDEELESILQECAASGVPARRLAWHYRSRHESLIAFSNHHYYDNELLTFPSADQDPDRLGVSLRKVQGAVYDRGKTQTNPVEARAVADEVVRILSETISPDTDSEAEPPTVGVVTFNQAQQQLIEELLEQDRRDRPDLDRAFDHEVEPVFVKNLENVQGDERDVILFSVGYGPDAEGRVSMNFGPLNQDGGERRLNVAVTRARSRVVVFSALDPEQIDLGRTRATGVAHLKRFLEYARRGPDALPQPPRPTGDPQHHARLAGFLKQHLEAQGFQVDTEVGCSGYRVDLGVRDPARPSAYAIGVTLDGPAYHAADTARDRDRLRHGVLTRLGWRLHRVWSADYLYDPAGCVARMDLAVHRAIQISQKDQNTGE